MIYITGDTHNDYISLMKRLSNVPIEEHDILIVAGDFGFVGRTKYHKWLPKIKEIPYTVCFIDGNHEDFELLYEYPVEEWNGGKIHKIADNIIHLMRGQVFSIEGNTFFTFGGADSIDKKGRTEGFDWWPQELPSNEDYNEARANLERVGYSVDYVITHTIPQSVIHRMGMIPNKDDAELTGYFEWLKDNLSFKRWFAGHFHVIEQYDNIEILYFNVVPIKQTEDFLMSNAGNIIKDIALSSYPFFSKDVVDRIFMLYGSALYYSSAGEHKQLSEEIAECENSFWNDRGADLFVFKTYTDVLREYSRISAYFAAERLKSGRTFKTAAYIKIGLKNVALLLGIKFEGEDNSIEVSEDFIEFFSGHLNRLGSEQKQLDNSEEDTEVADVKKMLSNCIADLDYASGKTDKMS